MFRADKVKSKIIYGMVEEITRILDANEDEALEMHPKGKRVILVRADTYEIARQMCKDLEAMNRFIPVDRMYIEMKDICREHNAEVERTPREFGRYLVHNICTCGHGLDDLFGPKWRESMIELPISKYFGLPNVVRTKQLAS